MNKPDDEFGSNAHRLNVYKAARKFARSIAGDDQSKYLSVLAAAQLIGEDVYRVKVVPVKKKTDTHSRIVEKEALETVKPPRRGTKADAQAENRTTIFHNPAVRDHTLRVLARNPIRASIVGGTRTPPNDYLDCVALGSGSGHWCCTGTLIHRRMVLTAGHCLDAGCASHVFVGADNRGVTVTNSPSRVYTVINHFRHDGYGVTVKTLTGPGGLSVDVYKNDLMIVILDRDVTGAAPRRIAAAPTTTAAREFRAVGFGITDTLAHDSGVKRDVRIASISNLCSSTDFSSTGCITGLEIYAGSMNKDTCGGDSGGPLYVAAGGNFFLSGVTSRGATATCGQGGIYVRIDKYLPFIQQVAVKAGLSIII